MKKTMADLSSGILGIMPTALKALQILSSQLKTFRDCSSIVQRMHKLMRVQRRIFKNECHLLLRDCFDDEAIAQTMIEDTSRDEWGKANMEEALRESLKGNYDECVELIQGIVDIIHRLEVELNCFKVVKSDQMKGESLKDSWKRASGRLKMTFNKSSYESGLDELQASNSELKCLREQVSQLQRPCRQMTVKSSIPKHSDWADIRRASKALHDALAGSWSCTQPTHSRHVVKMFLEAEKEDQEVQMNIAILCHGLSKSMVQIDFIELQVKSRQIEYLADLPPRMPQPGNNEDRPRKRLKTVRFSAQITTSCLPKSSIFSGTEKSPPITSLDLRSTEDFCSELKVRCGRQPTGTNTRCLGHLDFKTGENYRHQFFSRNETLCQSVRSSVMKTGNSIPMDAILCKTAGDDFSTVDKLKMARALAGAVLKFHATPWLGEAWCLQDLSFFYEGEEDLALALRTLHVGVEFGQQHLLRLDMGSTMDGVQMSSTAIRLSDMSENDQLFCGIDNIALHCLGVALLQIDRLKKFEPADVLNVRKAARISSTLGPCYQEITQKCLRCDFGYGNDLARKQLQGAVYDSVVGELDKMISILSISDD